VSSRAVDTGSDVSNEVGDNVGENVTDAEETGVEVGPSVAAVEATGVLVDILVAAVVVDSPVFVMEGALTSSSLVCRNAKYQTPNATDAIKTAAIMATMITLFRFFPERTCRLSIT
jgi:hypothetical protein